MRHGRRAGIVAAGLIIGATVLSATPAAAKSHAEVVLEGLSSPKALAGGPGNTVFVGQGAFGPPGQVLQVDTSTGDATPITDPINLVDIAGTPDGAGWGIGGDGVLYRQATLGGAVEPVFDIAAYQEGDHDPDDQDNFPEESNPYGLTGLSNNDVLIADAANNDVIRVSPNGDAVTVARWTRETIKTNKVHDRTLPKKLPAEAVPTSVAIGPDGWAYVGQLMGFPGTPKSAHIWRVNPDADGATCSVKAPNADCAVWKSGFTSIIDLEFARDGTLYVYQIAKDGWLAFEAGCDAGDCPPAVLLKVKGKTRHELAKGMLSQPGGVAVNEDGDLFVTDGIFGNGRLLRIN